MAKPGRLVVDGDVPGHHEAVLNETIIFERRLIYNSYEGFTARHLLRAHTTPVDFYKAMPLYVFLQPAVRKQAIMAFYAYVSRNRVDLSVEKRIEQLNEGEAVTAGLRDTNDFVRVEDIVHTLCKNLSPAASFMLCTGKQKAGNYGEKHVQRRASSRATSLQDYSTKEEELVKFIKTEPGTFDIRLVGYSKKKRPRENYEVSFTVFEIDSSSDESEL